MKSLMIQKGISSIDFDNLMSTMVLFSQVKERTLFWLGYIPKNVILKCTIEFCVYTECVLNIVFVTLSYVL